MGDGAIDGLDVLVEVRKIRGDVVLVAFTRSNSRTIPLKASHRPAPSVNKEASVPLVCLRG